MIKVFPVMMVAVLLAGCNSTNLNRARAVYETIEQQREAERQELADKQQAEKDALEAAQRAEREKADAKAAEEARLNAAAQAGPHGPQRRDAANQAGHQYFTAGEKPPMVGRDNPAWGRTLWKPVNDSRNGSVMLLDPRFMADYQAGRITRAVIAADPWGRQVINAGEVSGAGKVVKPYHERPAIRWDGALGQAWRPGPVFIVLFNRRARLAVFALDDPGMRTER